MKEEINSFREGLTDGVPIALGYLAVAFGFGIISVSCGLLWYEALLISMFNLTSAGQLAAVPIIASGGSLVSLASTQLVINSRYALMSVSLSQRLGRGVSFADRFLIGFANTDEIFAVATGKGAPLGRRYFLGLMLLPYLGWSCGTLIGAIAGGILPQVVVTALSVSLYAMFISIIVPAAKKERRVLLCVLAAIAVSCIFTYVPALSRINSGFGIVICTLLVSTVFAIVAPIPDEEKEGDAE